MENLQPTTFVDRMFAEMASNAGVASELVGTWAENKLEDLKPFIRVDMGRFLEMVGIRAKKIRPYYRYRRHMF